MSREETHDWTASPASKRSDRAAGLVADAFPHTFLWKKKNHWLFFSLIGFLLLGGCALFESDEDSLLETVEQQQDTVSGEVLPGLQLRGDGLGLVSFGTAPAQTLQLLEVVLGPPDVDSGWKEGFENSPGLCPGTRWRTVQWPQLRVGFSNGKASFGVADAEEHFFAYSYGYDFGAREAGDETAGDGDVLGLTTPEGIGLASTDLDVREAYGVEALGEGLEGDHWPDVDIISLFGPAFFVHVAGLAGGIEGVFNPETLEVVTVSVWPCGE